LQWRKKTCFSCPSLDFETMRGKSENLLCLCELGESETSL
jgi:hypothetical protein